MDLIQSVILGIVQGFTEFLPVSSSGHLILLQKIFGMGEVPLFYDVMLHVGTLIAVIIVLRSDIAAILMHPIKNKLGMLILATVPVVVVTLITEKGFPEIFDNIFDGRYLAFGFFATTIVLVLSETIARRNESKQGVGLKQALAMGFMQSAAVLPGLSRSGSSIAGGLMAGVGREQAARFAFLMSIPVIIGSAGYTALDVAETGLGDVAVVDIVVGTAVAAVCGFVAIKFMLSLISKHKLYGFAIYTAVLGTFVLVESLMFGQIFTSPFV